MRNGRLPLPAAAALVLLWSAAAEAAKPGDPCASITRRNYDKCLGTVLVPTSSAEDEVALDGDVVGKGPLLLHFLARGQHVIEVRASGAKPKRHAVLVLGGRSLVVPTGAAASLTRPGAPPLSQASFGFMDECDGFMSRSQASLYEVDANSLASLREDRVLAPHLPSVASILARAETGCQGGDAAACKLAGQQAQRGAGGREVDVSRAAGFFLQGCALHDRDSCVEVADAIASGAGFTRDPAVAAALRSQLCAQGDLASCRKLGETLAFDPASPRGREQSLPFLKKACEGHEWQACSFLEQIQIRVACDKGDPAACKTAGQPVP